MKEVALSRKQLALNLVNEIRQGLEEFYYVGVKLKQINDLELYLELGYADFLACCKGEFDWAKAYVYQLIKASEYRAALPSPKSLPTADSNDKPPEWSEKSVRELTRLKDKRDAVKVATKVLKAIEQSEKEAVDNPKAKLIKLTAPTVRKFVDAELGVDRAAKAKETRQRKEEEEAKQQQKREEEAHPLPEVYFNDLIWRLKVDTERVLEVDAEMWKQWKIDNSGLVKRLITACETFTDLLRST